MPRSRYINTHASRRRRMGRAYKFQRLGARSKFHSRWYRASLRIRLVKPGMVLQADNRLRMSHRLYDDGTREKSSLKRVVWAKTRERPGTGSMKLFVSLDL